MTYTTAIYYTIVTMSTIGYGDIYPVLWYTRMAQTVALIVNVTVMSNFLGKIIEFVFILSPYDTEYNFKDHIVITGGV